MMNENKKGLRITAGVLLLVIAVFSLAASAYSLVTVYSASGYMSEYYRQAWQPVASGALGIVAAILILAKKFTGAGIVRCLILAVSAAVHLLSIVPRFSGMPDLQSLTSAVPQLALWIADIVPAILLIVALFLHNRTSKPLLIVGAILALVLSIGQLAQTYAPIVKQVVSSHDIYGIGLSVGLTLSTAIVTMVAWLLLAAYFGAQKPAEQ